MLLRAYSAKEVGRRMQFRRMRISRREFLFPTAGFLVQFKGYYCNGVRRNGIFTFRKYLRDNVDSASRVEQRRRRNVGRKHVHGHNQKRFLDYDA